MHVCAKSVTLCQTRLRYGASSSLFFVRLPSCIFLRYEREKLCPRILVVALFGRSRIARQVLSAVAAAATAAVVNEFWHNINAGTAVGCLVIVVLVVVALVVG